MTIIPKVLQEHINTSFPANVCLVATVQKDGYAQITPRGSTMVFDDEHFALWERGHGSTDSVLENGTKVTLYFRKPELRQSGMLPSGGIARFYGVAELHRSGEVYEKVWERLIEPERNHDLDKKGFAVLIKVERAEDLNHQDLQLD